MERLALFDIDCTLIDAHGAGGRAVLRAIKEVFGFEGELGDYSFHGRTDPEILRDLASLWGADAASLAAGDARGDGLLGRCLERYVELLAGEVAEGDIEVLPGIRELVTVLAADRRVLLGLLTGNVEAGARMKLAPTGLWPLFAVGAYGSDSGSRPALPAVAVSRSQERCGRRFSGKEIAIVGDSPADVLCGAGLGVKAIAVATGRHSVDELARHAPDHVFADCRDWRAVYEAVLA